MAGFRIGYGTGTASLIHEIEKVRGPYKENAPAERAAACAVREDVAWMRDLAALAVANRERFADALRGDGLRPFLRPRTFSSCRYRTRWSLRSTCASAALLFVRIPVCRGLATRFASRSGRGR